MHNDVGLKGGSPLEDSPSNRDVLNRQLQQSPTVAASGAYPNSVDVVNDLLKRNHINLSNQSAENILDNLRRVDAGQMTHAGASRTGSVDLRTTISPTRACLRKIAPRPR